MTHLDAESFRRALLADLASAKLTHAMVADRATARFQRALIEQSASASDVPPELHGTSPFRVPDGGR